jgi:cbb3-type cytochrome oxidase subunit 3
LAALITEEGLVVLALGFIGWLYWLHLRGKREQASPERQRERQRREYWGRAKS